MPRRLPAHWILALLLLAARPSSADSGEIRLPGCRMSAELAATLVEARDLGRKCGPDAACWREGLARARQVRDAHPGEYDAHRAYVLDVRAARRVLGDESADPVAEEYRELAADHPDNPAYRHLVAQLTLDGDAYRKELESLTRSHPDDPWVHLSRTFLDARSTDPANRDAARAGYDAFAALCPDRVAEETQALVLIGDKDFARRRLDALRRTAIDSGRLEDLGTLWSLTLQSAPPEALAAARTRVAAEIGQVRSTDAVERRAGLTALLAAYQALGDADGEGWAQDRILAVAPCSDEAAAVRPGRLRARHPEPGSAAGRGDWLRAVTADLDRAIAACPTDSRPLLEKIEMLAPEAEAPATGLLDAVDRLRSLPQAAKLVQPSLGTWTAAIYLQRGLRLDRVPSLLEEDRAELEREQAAKEAAPATLAYRRRQELRLAASYALASGDLAGARERIRELEQAMAAARGAISGRGGAVAGEGAGVAEDRLDEETRLDLLTAGLASAAGRPEEALATLAPLVADPALRSAAEDAARAAWQQTHGATRGFDDWVSAAAAGLAAEQSWRRVDEAPPQAPLVELGSGPWNWQAHRGKTILVTVWASWCPAAIDLLPSLGKLLDALGARPDIEVVTLNADRTSSGMIAALDHLDGRVPVLAGGGALSGRGVAGVPLAWIVDSSGRIVRVRDGFDGDGDAWVASALAALGEVAGPAPADASLPAAPTPAP